MRRPAVPAPDALRKRRGSGATNERSRDRAIAPGPWAHPAGPNTDLVHRYLEKYARGGTILDLGCGKGEVGMMLDPAGYAHYTGVDVSAVALRQALVGSGADPRRRHKTDFVVADVMEYVPKRAFDVILLMEVLFRSPLGRMRAVLQRYGGYLREDGVFIAPIRDADRQGAVIRLVTRHFSLLEREPARDGKTVMLVFR